ncbi:hypothetical protein Ddye_000613 [Dipteronia dyeriana]|uniref:Uncharacterized protein n=1 Tax=Dipteronia dyeriana TaxID=168575 RepID=A0AAD9XM13_9ROSI|nr:hypothetical protein Ddye_000613 [Dipteronia dyeriana]
MDKFSLTSIISACGSIPSIELGEKDFAIGLESDPIIARLSIATCKCAFLENEGKLSHAMTWNSFLMGYATFTAVLSACINMEN